MRWRTAQNNAKRKRERRRQFFITIHMLRYNIWYAVVCEARDHFEWQLLGNTCKE